MEEPITQEELNSELTGLNKGEKEERKKQIIIGIVAFVLLLAIIIFIIIVASSGSKGGSDKEDKEDTDFQVIGEIKCLYEIRSNTENTLLLSDEFVKNTDFDIYIDNKKIKYSKEYKFPTTGEHNVVFKLYEGVNMDYMFKDIQLILSVEMVSNEIVKYYQW